MNQKGSNMLHRAVKNRELHSVKKVLKNPKFDPIYLNVEDNKYQSPLSLIHLQYLKTRSTRWLNLLKTAIDIGADVTDVVIYLYILLLFYIICF